jgi:hypothetical protein
LILQTSRRGLNGRLVQLIIEDLEIIFRSPLCNVIPIDYFVGLLQLNLPRREGVRTSNDHFVENRKMIKVENFKKISWTNGQLIYWLFMSLTNITQPKLTYPNQPNLT